MVLLVALTWAAFHRQDVIDWIRVRTYQPSAAVAQLAMADSMTSAGRYLFYASEPSVDDRIAFNQHCVNTSEHSLVLGCYAAQRIYVYDVTDPQLSGTKEVTAAHEMLHAAYERLSASEQQRVNEMLTPIIQHMTDPRILELIQLYNKQEPGQLYNEMHSVLATEYHTLSPELEKYYSRYFADRQKIVGYADRYQAIFSASKARIASYDQQLNALKTQIQANNASLETRQQDLNVESAQLSSLRNANNIDQYNRLVPDYNAKVNAFNDLAARTRQLIGQYNSLIDQRNQEAAAQNTLYQNLDSRYQVMPQN